MRLDHTLFLNYDVAGNDEQATFGAEEALEKQATTCFSSVALGHDCLLGAHDLEGSHGYFKGVSTCCCGSENTQYMGATLSSPL